MHNKLYKAEKLDPSTLSLSGRHLIEASAGTGKTYNITRLYLRLLLEKDLSVQQILVMTFTKAATEELRGRIDKELRHALLNWGDLGAEDPFFKVMETRFNKKQAQQKLKPALLELDEAAIYTIHGFCSRALTSQAFSSGLSLDISMEADSSELLLESIRDWLRKVAHMQTEHNDSEFALLAEKNWHDPEQFLSTFYRALTSSEPLEYIDIVELDSSAMEQLQQQKTQMLDILKDNEEIIFTEFVENHTESAALHQAWPLLISWLNDQTMSACSSVAGDFLKQGRLAKKAYAAIKLLLKPIYDFKQTYNKTFKIYLQDNKKYRNALRSRLIVEGIIEIREKFAQEKDQQSMMDFDDLITYLSQRVQSTAGQGLVSALRQQYPIALVDEFQDTDPHQYAILDCLYDQSFEQGALFMIGDPKQAIYAFRGGDIFSYLSAREGADYHWYMDTNWRSTESVVSAYNHLFSGNSLEGDSQAEVFNFGIGYENINAAIKDEDQLIEDPQSQISAINYALLNEVSNPSGKKGEAITEDWKNGLAQWCAFEISRLLTEVKLKSKLVEEKDIAILVRTGAEAQLIRDVLSQYNFPSVYLSDKENIFKSRQANELLLLLRGILECENNEFLIAALSTYLMGGNAEKLALYHENGVENRAEKGVDNGVEIDAEEMWEIQRERAIKLRDMWINKGCMTMLMYLIAHDYQPEPTQHERSLTNMIHLAELLQQASRQYKHPQQLLKWFIDQCHADNTQDSAQLRLESDANLIRIITQHGSKGLEYPIVFIPFASVYKDPVRFGNNYHEYFAYHDPLSYAAKCLVGQSDEVIELAKNEGEAESIRLLYVAMTRAVNRCYLGIAPFKKSAGSALGLALKLSHENDWQAALEQLVQSNGCYKSNISDNNSISENNNSSSLIIIDDSQLNITPHRVKIAKPENYKCAKLDHKIDEQWSLSSFSSLIRDTYTMQQAMRLEQKDRLDESIASTVQATTQANAENSIRFSLRKGADSGNLLHDILQHTNFSSVDNWPVDGPILRYGGLDEVHKTELIAWLQDCLDTSLPLIGKDNESFKLSDLSWSETLRECEFYFPINNLQLNTLSSCLQLHRVDNNRVKHSANNKLKLPDNDTLQGMMRGFIDLIFEYQGRFYVADYKSTHLGEQFENYHWAALKENNQQHYYDLQYLIYSLALHRYLRLRISDYDPALHFGGVYYLYLRGMSQDNSEPYGIFHSSIALSLLEQLDQSFQGAPVEFSL